MPASSLWLISVGPLALAGLGSLPNALADRHPDAVQRVASVAAALALLAMLGIAPSAIAAGPLQTPLIGFSGIGLRLYVDTLTVTMGALVAFIGLVVIGYSRRYLDGEPRRGRFLLGLCRTLAAVELLIIAGNLLQFAVAWGLISLSLHPLLLFYPGRPAAVLAARKKFVVSRLGDLCLIGALLSLFQIFHSLDYVVILPAVDALRAAHTVPPALHGVAALLVAVALLKSAQFPLHGWLLEVMETPTPVSALLHAGVINAGGFLLLRFSGLVTCSTPALDALALIGGFTALFGSVVMLTQTSIKVSLAYSTIGQMGFMMLECGLGAFSAALLHLVGHSLYKAHAFLSAGSVLDGVRPFRSTQGRPTPPMRLSLLALALTVVAGFFVLHLAGVITPDHPGAFVLASIVLLGAGRLAAAAVDARPDPYVLASVLLRAVGLVAAYAVARRITERLLGGILATQTPPHSVLDVALVAIVLVSFGLVTVWQSVVPARPGSARWRALQVHVANGLYVNTLTNRLIVRWWPAGAESGARP